MADDPCRVFDELPEPYLRVTTTEELTPRDSEARCVDSLKERVSRSSDTLTISLVCDSTITLVDIEDSINVESNVAYALVNWHSAIDSYEINMIHWEGSTTMLLNSHSGKCTYLIGSPVLSPDNHYFIASNWDLFSNYSATGFQVWTVESDSLALQWEVLTEDWGPVATHWIDSSSFIMQAIPVSGSPVRCVKAIRRNGKWEFDS